MSSVYSIKELEKLSGIKAHTLRIWEKRYGIIQPKRTETNIRYFLDEDLKQVLNIALLNKNGHKISKIALMGEQQISQEIEKISQSSVGKHEEIDAIILAILELNSTRTKKILNTKVEVLGFRKVIDEFIYPLLDKLGMMWISGTLKPVHESFIRSIIKNKVCSEIDKIADPNPNASKFIIYLPENENHELSMLFLEFILKNKGASVINLGEKISIHDLFTANQIYEADYAFTIINDSLKDESLQSMIDFLSHHIPDVTHLFTGFQFVKQDLSFGANCRYIENLNAVEQYI